MSEILRQRAHYRAVRQRLFGQAAGPDNAGLVARRAEEGKARAAAERAARLEDARRKRRRQAESGLMLVDVAAFSTATEAEGHFAPAAQVAAENLGTLPPQLEMRDIALLVLGRHEGSGLRDLLSVSRTRPVVAARRDVIQAIRRLRPDLSLPAIGRFFGKDHTTILQALKQKVKMPGAGEAS